MYKQYLAGANISLEKGTGNVPDDNKYHIVKDDKIIFTHKSEKVAMAKFSEFKPQIKNREQVQIKNKKQFLGNEIADRLIGQQASDRISKNRKKGGKKGLK